MTSSFPGDTQRVPGGPGITPEPAGQSRTRTGGLWRAPPQLRARILLNSGILFVGRGVSALGAVILLSLLTRYLGPSGFGRYTFVLGYISLFYVITDFGSQAIAVRDMARDPEQAPVIAGQLFTVKLVMAGVAFLGALGASWLLPISTFHLSGVRLAIVLAALSFFSVPAVTVAATAFQTQIRMGVPALADAASRLLSVGLVAALAANLVLGASASVGWRLAAVVAAGTAGAWCGAALAFVGARRLLPLRPRMDVSLSTPLVRDAIPLAVVFVLGIIHYRIDVVVLSLMKGISTVGLYGVATKLLDIALAGSAVFMSLAFPVFSARAGGDPVLLRRAFQKTLDFLLIVGVGAALFCSLLAPALVSLIAGGRFHQAQLPVAIIAWAIPITFANTVVAHMVVAANQQWRAVPVTLAAIALNIVLNVILIPHMGAAAPALVTVLTEGLSAVAVGIIMVSHYHFGPSFGSMARIALSAALAGLTLFALQPFNRGLDIGAGAAAYAAALFLTRAVTLADVRTVLSLE